MARLTVLACAPPRSPAKQMEAAAEVQEVAVDSVSRSGPGMPTWLEGKLDPSHVAWADNAERHFPTAPSGDHARAHPDRRGDRFQQCAGSGAIGDDIRVQFRIDANGRAGEVSVECVEPTDTSVRDCIANVLSELRFPAPPNGLKLMYLLHPKPK